MTGLQLRRKLVTQNERNGARYVVTIVFKSLHKSNKVTSTLRPAVEKNLKNWFNTHALHMIKEPRRNVCLEIRSNG